MFVNRGKKEFLEVYERLWLHSREEVTVIQEENGVKDKVVIRGLDPNGYLEVRSKTSGKLYSVFDDGNTFDLLKGKLPNCVQKFASRQVIWRVNFYCAIK